MLSKSEEKKINGNQKASSFSPYKLKFLTAGIAFLSLGLSGCSQMSKKDCMNVNWEKKGIEDGRSGQASDNILETKKACAEEGVSVSVIDYKKGWLTGIEKYCSPEGAYKLGKEKGESKSENCPVELRSQFNNNYERGLNFAKKNKKIKKLESKIADKQDKKNQLNAEIEDLKNEILSYTDKKENLISEKDKIKKNADELSSRAVKYDIK